MLNTNSPSFVFGINLDGKGGCSSIGTPEEFNWVHIDYSHASAREDLIELSIPSVVVDSIIREDTRPKVVRFDDGVLLIVRAINSNPGADPEDMVSLRIWIEEQRLVTVRQRRLLSVQDIHEELTQGVGPRHLDDVIILLIQKIVDRIADFVESIDDRLDNLESLLLDNTGFEERAKTTLLRREIAVVRRYLSPQREALQTMHTLMRGRLSEEQQFDLREQADRMLRYVEDLDLLRERALVLNEQMMNLVMEQQNQRMYALSIIAAVFLPITFVTGIFGMNVAGLPGLENPDAFAYVAGGMAIVTICIITYFKVNRWL